MTRPRSGMRGIYVVSEGQVDGARSMAVRKGEPSIDPWGVKEGEAPI